MSGQVPTRLRSGRATERQGERGRAAAVSLPRSRRAAGRSATRPASRTSARAASRAPTRRRAASTRARSTDSRREPTDDFGLAMASLQGVVASLREELQRQRDEADGDLQQATIDDLRSSQGGDNGLQGEVELAGTTSAPPVSLAASRTPATATPDAAKASTKERVRMWADLRRVKAWIVLGRTSAVSKLSRAEWQAMPLNSVSVIPRVAASLDSLSGFRVQDYRWGTDDPEAEVPLDESLQILLATIITMLKKGIRDPEHVARVGILEDSFNVGLEMVREHCREHRGEVRNAASISRFAGFINDDLKVFASKWLDVAISFKATYFAPPDVIEDFPAVPTIDWKQTSGFVSMGGVGAAVYYRPTIRAGEPLLSPSKRSRRTTARGSKRVGFCYAFNSPSGCHDGTCPYVHEKNPARTNGGLSEATSIGARGRVGVFRGSGTGEGEGGSGSHGTGK